MNRPGERGIVLIAVLLAVAIMSVMVVAVTTLTRSGIASQRLEDRLLASRIALRSGLESAKALIAATPPDERALFNGTPVELDLGQGIRVEIIIRDAAGLVDVNRTDMQLLSAVLEGALQPEVAKSLSAQIEEMRKKAARPEDGQQKSVPAEPEDPAPEGQKKPPPTNNDAPGTPTTPEDRPQPLPVVFQSVDQALLLASPDAIRDEEWQAATARLTVFNPTAVVNPFAAPDPVLLALPGIRPRDIAAIDEARKNRAWRGDGRIEQILERFRPFLGVEEPSVFMISVRLIAGPGIIAQSSASAVVQLLEGSPLPYRTLFVSGL